MDVPRLKDTDEGGSVKAIMLFFLVTIIICLIARIYIRSAIHGPWHLDDWFVASSTATSCLRTGLVIVGLSRGYGVSSTILSIQNLMWIERIGVVENMLYILALFLSKFGVVLICLRLTTHRIYSNVLLGLVVLIFVWVEVSVLVLTINCDSGYLWKDLPSQCSHLNTRWNIICSLDIFTEIPLFLASVYLASRIKVDWNLRIFVVLAFGCRFITILFAACHLASFLDEYDSTDPTLLSAYTAKWAQVQIDYSLMCSLLSAFALSLTPVSAAIEESLAPQEGLSEVTIPVLRPLPMAKYQRNTSDVDPLPSLPASALQNIRATKIVMPSSHWVKYTDNRRAIITRHTNYLTLDHTPQTMPAETRRFSREIRPC